jgi:SAM-dependent methyltransferase
MTDVQSGVACRACGELKLSIILSLGQTPLANALLTAEQLHKEEDTYPLDLAFCPTCYLVQITETVTPEKLFREYFYRSSFSDTMLRHAEETARFFSASRNLDQHSLVVEIASNDGYLLQFYQRAGIQVLGIEPAINIAEIAKTERNIPTICEFFGETLARRLASEGRRADVIHANNVLAHVPDLNGVVRAFAALLKPGGIAVIEVPYVKDMIDRCEFDTIYHEHLSYFSLTALYNLFSRHGVLIVDVERLPIHGGTLRIVAALKTDEAAAGGPSNGTTAKFLQEEADWGVGSLAFYEGFVGKIERLRHELLAVLRKVKAEGARIAAYGASAKGSTLLAYFGIGHDILDYVVDRSTLKQNHYTPGTHLQIYSPEKLLTDMPDYVLLLTWNFADEILEQQSQYRERGGRFIVPIPQLRIV